MDNANEKYAFFVVAAIFIGGIFLLTRKSHSSISSQPVYYKPRSIQYSQTIERQGVEPRVVVPKGARQYQNEETWDIDWTPDGLPKRVTIHRNAVQT